MKMTQSLKRNHEFRRLYKKGKSAVSPYMALYCAHSRGKGSRLGITVGTKIGKAVGRNRVRRRLREIYRLNEDRLLPGFDMVIVARVRAASATYAQLEHSYLQLAGKLGVLRTQNGVSK